MRPYFGLTGYTETTQLDVALDFVDKQLSGLDPYQLMVGVLANQETLHGNPSKHTPARHPDMHDAQKLFYPAGNVLNLFHYSTPNPDFLEELKQLIRYGGPNLHGFQLNKPWPNPKVYEAFRNEGHSQVIVQQIGERAFEKIGHDPKKLVTKIKAEYIDLVDYILLDPSGGKGQPMNIEAQRGYLSELYSALVNQKIMIGIAGGISPYNLHELTPLFIEFDDLSCDTEGSVRDKNDDDLLFTEMVKLFAVGKHHVVLKQPNRATYIFRPYNRRAI